MSETMTRESVQAEKHERKNKDLSHHYLVKCPTCNARPKHPCVTPHGLWSVPHSKRKIQSRSRLLENRKPQKMGGTQ
jgi:hypothetical protein